MRKCHNNIKVASFFVMLAAVGLRKSLTLVLNFLTWTSLV